MCSSVLLPRAAVNHAHIPPLHFLVIKEYHIYIPYFLPSLLPASPTGPALGSVRVSPVAQASTKDILFLPLHHVVNERQLPLALSNIRAAASLPPAVVAAAAATV